MISRSGPTVGPSPLDHPRSPAITTHPLHPEPIIAAELREVGYKENPANSNHTKFGVAFGLDREPWCAIFQYQEFLTTFGKVPWAKTASTLGIAQQFQALKRFGAEPRIGALALYSFDGLRIDHVELVKDFTASTIDVIGGNTSAADGSPNNGGEVAHKTRPRDHTVRGFAYIPYVGVPGHAPKDHHDLGVRTDLRQGDTGPDVLVWKHDLERLAKAHLYPAAGTELAHNQTFGRNTEVETKAFQSAHHLTVDGVVGPHTLTKAEQLLKRRRVAHPANRKRSRPSSAPKR